MEKIKVKVTHKFRDKDTKELHLRGQIIEVTEERFKEIMKAGNFVQKLPQNAVETPEGADTTNPATDSENAVETASEGAETPKDGFDAMNVAELKEYADKAHKLTFKAGTKKADIVETLRRMEQKELKSNG